MGKEKGGDRKATKASSSARAAEVLANKAAGAGFGFGGFSGAAPVTPNVPGFAFGGAAAARLAAAGSASAPAAAATDADSGIPLTAQVDGDIAQCLRHLTKKDPTTKVKALQNLRALLPQRPLPDLLSTFPPWAYVHRRLILDHSRAVRAETASTLAVLLGALGKAIAPHLKGVMGPWYLAMHDPYGEAAATNRGAFQASFPTQRKQLDALLFCRSELMAFLKDQLAATPQQLGDARKDSPEELEDRHERVQAACLAALASLLDLVAAQPSQPATAEAPPAPAPGSAEAEAEVLAAVQAIMCKAGFWKSVCGSKSALVRRAAYGLAARAAQRAPAALAACLAEASPSVLGALGEKDPANHAAMWEAVLSLAKSLPDCWRHVNMRKALLPRLYALVRHACFGSAAASAPALLPLVSLLPAEVVGPQPDVLVALLDSVWVGMADTTINRPGRVAFAVAYRECLSWGLIHSVRLEKAPASGAPPAALGALEVPGSAYCQLLVRGTVSKHLVPLALEPSGQRSETAREMLIEVLQQLCTSAASKVAAAEAAAATASAASEDESASATPTGRPSLQQLCEAPDGPGAALTACVQALQQQLADAAAQLAAVDGAAPAAADPKPQCDQLAALLSGLRQVLAASCPSLVEQLAASVATSITSSAVSGHLSPAASSLLAGLIRQYRAPVSMLSPAPSLSSLTLGRTASCSTLDSPRGAGATLGGAATPASAATLGSFSVDTLVLRYLAAPAAGAAAQASADLLVACCQSAEPSGDAWDLVVTRVLEAGDGGDEPAHLRRLEVLLQRLATALPAAGGGDGGSSAADGSTVWQGCSALDEAARRLAGGPLCCAMVLTGAAGDEPGARNEPVAGLLACCLGGNAAGALLLQLEAAHAVLQQLSDKLMESLDDPDDPRVAAQAAQALHAVAPALQGPAGGLWRSRPLLPLLCGLLVGVYRLAWLREGAAQPAGAVQGNLMVADPDASDSEADADESGLEAEEGEPHIAGNATDGDDSEDDDSTVAPLLAHTLRLHALAELIWAGGKAVRDAVAAQPGEHARTLVRRLAARASVMEEDGEDGQAPALSAGAWARAAAALIGGLEDEGLVQHVALPQLLSPRTAWSVWASTEAVHQQEREQQAAEPAAGDALGPCAHHLAELVAAVGPRKVLAASGRADAARDGAPSDPAAGEPGASGRPWVVVELLCNAAADGVGGHSGASQKSSSLLRRAAAATLQHAVAAADGDASYQWLLQRAIDTLAEGCRDGPPGALSAPGSSSSSSALAGPKAVYLRALCDATAALARRPTGPSLQLLQRLCRHWLAPCTPADAAAAGASVGPGAAGLQPAALLQLLPILAPALRCAGPAAASPEAALHDSQLAQLCSAWMRRSAGLPPVSVQPRPEALQALELAVACLPVAPPASARARGGSGGAALPAATAALVDWELLLAEEERPLLVQLLRHQAVRHAAQAAAKRHGADATALAGEEEGAQSVARRASKLVAHLELCAACYHARGLAANEWHAVLQDTQAQLEDACAQMACCVSGLAQAACRAADRVLAAAPSAAGAAATQPPVALQLLRKLAARGVLARHACHTPLLADVASVLAAADLGGACEASAQLVAVLGELLQHQPGVALQQYSDTVVGCYGQVLQLAVLVGGAESCGQACGDAAAAAVEAWCNARLPVWHAAGRCVSQLLSLRSAGGGMGARIRADIALRHAVDAQAPALQAAGLDVTSALLAVALAQQPHVLQPAAYGLLLEGALVGTISVADAAAAAATPQGSTDPDLPEYEGDDSSYLTAAGLRPEMVPILCLDVAAAAGNGAGSRAAPVGDVALSPAQQRRQYLSAWALLLAHLVALPSGSRGAQLLKHALREAPHVVHRLLDELVAHLPLQQLQGRGSKGRATAAASARLPAATGAGTSAPPVGPSLGGDWELCDVLQAVGLPSSGAAVRQTCSALFRAVLRTLPATARGWFTDLRDRGLASAVEAYTSAEEGPVLLAAEVAAVQQKAAGVKGDSKFVVRASAVSREVVATMEVDDGASLELVVRLPACLPLRPPEVECRRKVGVNETRLRKWLLSISAFLRHQNGSVADAIALWKRNVDVEFEGVEPCLICYCVISSVNSQLPRLVCRTCGVRFHPACLYKWFKSAGKSQCPHCQALW